jgi:hypothetical protein
MKQDFFLQISLLLCIEMVSLKKFGLVVSIVYLDLLTVVSYITFGLHRNPDFFDSFYLDSDPPSSPFMPGGGGRRVEIFAIENCA